MGQNTYYYYPGENWFLSKISPFSDEVIPNPSLHWFMKLQRIGKEYQQFVPDPPYPKVFGAWPQFKVQMWSKDPNEYSDLVNYPPFGTVNVRVPNWYQPGWKQIAPEIKLNMRYFPEGDYVVPGLRPEEYDEIEAQRQQRESELGRPLPRVVPPPSPRSWKRPVLAPRSLGAASVVPFPVKSQWGTAEESETEITWIHSNWMQYAKPSKKQQPLLPSGNPDLFA
jgi:hypothetical protein